MYIKDYKDINFQGFFIFNTHKSEKGKGLLLRQLLQLISKILIKPYQEYVCRMTLWSRCSPAACDSEPAPGSGLQNGSSSNDLDLQKSCCLAGMLFLQNKNIIMFHSIFFF